MLTTQIRQILQPPAPAPTGGPAIIHPEMLAAAALPALLVILLLAQLVM